MDECDLPGPPVCGRYSECENNIGSYTCSCDEEYYSPSGSNDDCEGMKARLTERQKDMLLICNANVENQN